MKASLEPQFQVWWAVAREIPNVRKSDGGRDGYVIRPVQEPPTVRSPLLTLSGESLTSSVTSRGLDAWQAAIMFLYFFYPLRSHLVHSSLRPPWLNLEGEVPRFRSPQIAFWVCNSE